MGAVCRLGSMVRTGRSYSPGGGGWGLVRRERLRHSGAEQQDQGEGVTEAKDGHDVAYSCVWIVLRVSASSSLDLE